MQLSYPKDLGLGKGKFWLIFPSKEIEDRGITLESLVKTREPFAIFDKETKIATDIGSGRQVTVGICTHSLGGIPINSYDINLNRIHTIEFDNFKDLTLFLGDHYAGISVPKQLTQ